MLASRWQKGQWESLSFINGVGTQLPSGSLDALIVCELEGCSCQLSLFCLRSGHSAEARNLMGIAHSILSSGFHVEESLISRDTLPGMSQLKFGQGMKRGLSAKLVRLGRILLNACHCQVQCRFINS